MSTSPITIDEVADQTMQILAKSYANQWIFIPIDGLSPAAQNDAHRLNGLGSLFYFTKIILQKHRLTEHFHRQLCTNLEKDHLKEVIEVPRDHFKTTIHSEGAPMWWALPFNARDEMLMRALGYSDEWISWMKRSHDQDTRTLTISENIKNACKIGRKIDFHYTNNAFFKQLFPEIQPSKSDNWSVETMTHKRSGTHAAAHGEGTYDYLGVDAALQSRHYKRIVQDDLVGKNALDSEIVMNTTIDYHRLLSGAFDSDPKDPDNDNDEIVVGNRWSYKDLNWWIRKNEKSFNITTHSALGGCCPLHPPNQVLFPEEWTIQKLNRWKERFGSYFFSCQFLNSPTPPGDTKFKQEWINYFTFGKVDAHDKRVVIKHEVRKGQAYKDIFPTYLQRDMWVDPNHAGEDGRCNHAVLVTGFSPDPVRFYLLDVFALNSSHESLVNKMYEFGEKWKITEPWVETNSGQKWLKYHLTVMNETRRKAGKFTFRKVKDLKVSRAKDAKIQRIESLEPMFSRGEFWMNKFGQEKFLQEYLEYPYSPTIDVMDVLGHALANLDTDVMSDREISGFLHKQQSNFKNRSSRNSITGY